jgi:hypothetical protein
LNKIIKKIIFPSKFNYIKKIVDGNLTLININYSNGDTVKLSRSELLQKLNSKNTQK